MVLSAHLSADLRAAYQELAVDAIVDKPFSVNALQAKVRQLAA
jgi:DNA-binding response OmpR family regulator